MSMITVLKLIVNVDFMWKINAKLEKGRIDMKWNDYISYIFRYEM